MTAVVERLTVEEVFSHALHGEPCYVVAEGLERTPLPIQRWTRRADSCDRQLLDLCQGATLDIGCGPGRLTIELAARGHIALGIDIVAESITQTRRRGGTALQRDIFSGIPCEGRWRTALLADGNIGIGGDPVKLLNRVRRVLGPGGLVVVETSPPPATTGTWEAHLECSCGPSLAFAWALVSAEDLAGLATRAGLHEVYRSLVGGRQFAVLREQA